MLFASSYSLSQNNNITRWCSLVDVFDIEQIEIDNDSPNHNLEGILNEEDNNAVQPDPESNEASCSAGKSANWNIIKGGAWPEQGQSGWGHEGNWCADNQDLVWFSLEEELMSSSGWEQGEDIRNSDFQEHDTGNVTIIQRANSQLLEHTLWVVGVEAPEEEE